MKEIKPSPQGVSVGTGNYIHIPACTVSTKRHPSLPRPVLPLWAGRDEFRYVVPHCNWSQKGHHYKGKGEKDLKGKAKIGRPVKLMTWSSKSEVEQDIQQKAVSHLTHDLNQRHDALKSLKGMSGCKSVCQPKQATRGSAYTIGV